MTIDQVKDPKNRLLSELIENLTVILVYDVTCVLSLDTIKDVWNELKKYDYHDLCPTFIMAGNKIDLVDCCVSDTHCTGHGLEWCKIKSMSHVRCSATKVDTVQNLFKTAVKASVSGHVPMNPYEIKILIFGSDGVGKTR